MSSDLSAIIETNLIQSILYKDLAVNKDIELIKEKLESIEIIIAHHDKIISEMNDVILTQWKKLDVVEKKLMQLHEDIKSMNDDQEMSDQRPPHY